MSYASIIKDFKISDNSGSIDNKEKKVSKEKPKELMKILEEEVEVLSVTDDERIRIFNRLLISSEYDILNDVRKIRTKYKNAMEEITTPAKKEELRGKYREFLSRLEVQISKHEEEIDKSRNP
jgi:hypothetical protein